MHIGLVIYGSLDTLSGGYLYDRMLVRALEAAGHRVSIYSTPWRSYAQHLTDNGDAGLRRHLLAAPVDLWLQDELNHPSLFWLNRTLRRHHPAPIVAVVHHLRSSEEHPRHLLPLYRRIERVYLATLDGYLANSHTTHATVQALLGAPRPFAGRIRNSRTLPARRRSSSSLSSVSSSPPSTSAQSAESSSSTSWKGSARTIALSV